ncbi:MipA/OmpV family protein [Telluria beijingensis]|uniref:MipA/OmpV family protein n=1 Tax=Telluria beijingensis TaxID=3068633 RepID=UPI0027958A7C|nr:MipA/OmpV family protein [Massilia sp. REN29]
MKQALQSARILATSAALACAASASAQVVAPEQVAAEASPKTSQWGLGLGVGLDKSPLRDFDDEVDPLPLVLYEGKHLSVFGARIDYKLPSYGPLQFRLRARYANDGYEAKDSPYLAGMEERKGGLWLGGAATWRSGAVSVAGEFTAATGDAEGRRLKLELNREFRSGALTVTPRISAEWYDKDFVAYYYGVRANEVRPDRRAYSGDASQAIEAGVRFGYAIQRRHHVFIDVSARSLGSEIKDSPLVERSTESSIKLGYLYAF